MLRHGLHAANSDQQDPNYIQIGNPDLIEKRTDRPVPIEPWGTLSDYVPFYFTPFSPMMYNIHTGRGVKQRPNSDICILVSSLHRVIAQNLQWVFSDRHAYQELANYYNKLDELSNIDWTSLQNRDFNRQPDDPEKFEKYQAEALVYRHLPVSVLIGVICYSQKTKDEIALDADACKLDLDIRALPRWYF